MKPNLDPDYLKALKIEHERIELHTGLNFLKEHHGLHRGKLHLIIGTTGSGKSSAVRLLLEDIVQQNNKKRITIWQSEETIEDFEVGITGGSLNLKENILTCPSEQDLPICNRLAFFQSIHESDIFIFDNITTSILYGQKPEEQSAFAMALKKETIKSRAVVIVVAHTNNILEGAGKLLDISDIRGSKTIANIVEYAYILQMFSIGNRKVQTIRIAKSRGFTVENHCFQLGYDTKARRYIGDMAMTFASVKELHNARNRL